MVVVSGEELDLSRLRSALGWLPVQLTPSGHSRAASEDSFSGFVAQDLLLTDRLDSVTDVTENTGYSPPPQSHSSPSFSCLD